MPRHFLSVWGLILSSIVSLCACRQDLTTQHTEPNSIFHERKITMPTAQDDAKIAINAQTVVLTKAHLSDVHTELYQPSFRLEGVIAPITTSTVYLPNNASLHSLSVRLGDKVTQHTAIAHINEQIFELVHEPADKSKVFNDELPLFADEPSDDSPTIQPLTKITAINAPISGKIEEIFIHDTTTIHPKGTALMVISDDKHLKFISLLPKKYKEYLGVGKAVNFSTNAGQSFVGQIAKIQHTPKDPDNLEVHVHISPDETKQLDLKIGDWVSGHINYGQMSVGALVPGFAIFDDELNHMDLSALNEPPHKPATPIHANLWLIGQDETIRLTATEVIEYRPNSGQYLVAGVPPEKLICLARLPKESSGKQVRLDWSF